MINFNLKLLSMKNYMNFINYVAVLLILLIVSCNDDNEDTALEENNLTALKSNISGTNFSSAVMDVPVASPIEIIFSHSLNTDKVTSSLNVTSGSGTVDYGIDFSNTNSTVTLTPNNPFEYQTDYTISLPAGAYGVNGETLENPLTIAFSTESFVIPNLTLSTDATELSENGETAVITATLSKESNEDVTGTLVFEGTATETADYIITGDKMFTIPEGMLSVSFSITTVLDGENEGNETIEVSLTDLSNATNNEQNLTFAVIEQLPALSLKGIMALTWDGAGNNDGKAIHLIANQDIADLSIYGLGTANNGGGTDGNEYTLPAMSVSAGDDILVAREVELISAYFGNCVSEFEHLITAETAINQNGDDAIELFQGDTVIETYGDNSVDGTGESWEYKGSWAYKFDGFWTTGGVDCSVGSTTVDTSSCPYPICAEALMIQGVMALKWEGSGSNGGKAVHLKATKNIADLSIYSIGVANNGGGTDGIEFTLPAIAVEEGDDILLSREQATLASYFGSCISSFEHIIETETMNQNGDDAIELFNGDVIVETYGDANVDGTGEAWEYSGTWAYKVDGVFMTGDLDCAAGSTNTQDSACSYPSCN